VNPGYKQVRSYYYGDDRYRYYRDADEYRWHRWYRDFQSEHTKNEAVQQTGPRARRTFARLAFADYVHGLVAIVRQPPQKERKY
jgi:hypothetical protein